MLDTDMNDHPDPSDKVKELLSGQPFGVLVTNDGHPHVSLVSYWVSDDGKRIVFLTSKDTRKYTNILSDERATFMVDDRTNSPSSDIRQASAVSALGRAREASSEETGILREAFLIRHPYMGSFASMKDTAVMVLEIDSLQVVSRFLE